MAVSDHNFSGWRRWPRMGLTAIVLVLAVFYTLHVTPSEIPDAPPASLQKNTVQQPAQFTGSASCAGCHAEQHQAWEHSQHRHAMAHASTETVLADFNNTRFEYAGISSRFRQRDGRYFVSTDGPEGELTEYEVLYTFGLDPLRSEEHTSELQSRPHLVCRLLL